MTKSPGRRYIISKQQSNIYSFIQHICCFLSIQPKQKRLSCISLWFSCLSFLFKALRFVIVFYVLDIFWVELTFLSLGLVTLRALLISCLSFSVLCLVFGFYRFFNVLDFCPSSSFDLLFEFCVLSFSYYLFFQCVRFSGLYWLFPPQAWLPCRPF